MDPFRVDVWPLDKHAGVDIYIHLKPLPTGTRGDVFGVRAHSGGEKGGLGEWVAVLRFKDARIDVWATDATAQVLKEKNETEGAVIAGRVALKTARLLARRPPWRVRFRLPAVEDAGWPAMPADLAPPANPTPTQMLKALGLKALSAYTPYMTHLDPDTVLAQAYRLAKTQAIRAIPPSPVKPFSFWVPLFAPEEAGGETHVSLAELLAEHRELRRLPDFLTVVDAYAPQIRTLWYRTQKEMDVLGPLLGARGRRDITFSKSSPELEVWKEAVNTKEALPVLLVLALLGLPVDDGLGNWSDKDVELAWVEAAAFIVQRRLPEAEGSSA